MFDIKFGKRNIYIDQLNWFKKKNNYAKPKLNGFHSK